MTSEIQIFLFTSQHVKQVISQHWAMSIPTSYPTEPMLYTAAERAVDSGDCLPPQGIRTWGLCENTVALLMTVHLSFKTPFFLQHHFLHVSMWQSWSGVSEEKVPFNCYDCKRTIKYFELNWIENEPQHHTCQTHTVYLYKIQFFHYLGGIWPYWKMDTGKHKFHEILLLCKTKQKDWKIVEWAADTRHCQMHTDWPSAIG